MTTTSKYKSFLCLLSTFVLLKRHPNNFQMYSYLTGKHTYTYHNIIIRFVSCFQFALMLDSIQFSVIQMRLPCIIRVKLWGLKTYFKRFDHIFTVSFSAAPCASGDDRGSAERAAYASLHIHSNLTARGLSHGMEFTHKHTHTQKVYVCTYSLTRRHTPPCNPSAVHTAAWKHKCPDLR